MNTELQEQIFKDNVWEYYKNHGRHDLPWRRIDKHLRLNPYHVLVSEFMLQQTQVARVITKFTEFITIFPTIEVLARTQLGEVLVTWSGLGYNRRAKYLHETAQIITAQYGGEIPQNVSELMMLPGIGRNTACAIVAYSYNMPVTYIETNIRSVYIHHFYQDQINISDSELLSIIEKTVDTNNPREWYWALMDYGAHLKRAIGNPGRKSKHYAKQASFVGSLRQVRGAILRALINGPQSQRELAQVITDDRLQGTLKTLREERLIHYKNSQYFL